ncbi:MAG: bifunctional alpha/beta hydrolase/OsmC family protein [bacterium]
MQTRWITLTDDGLVRARLDAPEGATRAWALFAHCFVCTDAAADAITRALAGLGVATLRLAPHRAGGAEGPLRYTGTVHDLRAAAAWLEAHAQPPALLIGHSLGGAAALAAAEALPGVKGVATVGAPFEPGHMVRVLGARAEDGPEEGPVQVELDGHNLLIDKDFLDDLGSARPARWIAELGRSLLVLHSPVDQVVGVDHARRIFESARHPKSFVSLDRADHALSRPGDAAYAASMIAAWAARLIPSASPAAGAHAEEVVVWETRGGRYQQVVEAGPHRLTADEPQTVGGDGTGPNPYDLLLAALGACTSMTLRMYAERKGLPLDQVAVRLAHRKLPAADCPDCETKTGHVDEIERTVEIRGALDPDQRASLLRIADRCPVHRTLLGRSRSGRGPWSQPRAVNKKSDRAGRRPGRRWRGARRKRRRATLPTSNEASGDMGQPGDGRLFDRCPGRQASCTFTTTLSCSAPPPR